MRKGTCRNEALDCRVYAYAALSAGLSGAQLNLFCDRSRSTAGESPARRRRRPRKSKARSSRSRPRRDSGANARNPFLNGPGGHFLGGRQLVRA